MALETLKGVTKIGGFEVGINPHKDDIRKVFIHNHPDRNEISFIIQKGPIKEVGVNGCQVDTIIEVAKFIIEGLNENYPCRENAMVITKLDEALLWLMKRKLDREARSVEGENKL